MPGIGITEVVDVERSALAGHESGQDHLAIYMQNRPQYLESMLAGWKARVAPFNVNYRYVAGELRYLLADAGATAIVVQSTFAPTLAAVLPELPRLRMIIQVADESGHDLLPGAVWFDDAVAGGFEGAVVKDPSASYAAGRRDSGWIKVKPRHTLDLAVIGAEWGYGRRQGKLSNLHLAARGADGGPVRSRRPAAA